MHAGQSDRYDGGLADTGRRCRHADSGVVRVDGLRSPLASRGAAIVMSPNEKVAAVVNRDVGSLSVLSRQVRGGQADDAPSRSARLNLGAGSEPWQVVITPDNETAFVVLRKDQKVVRIKNLSDQARGRRLRRRRLGAHVDRTQPERPHRVRDQLGQRRPQRDRHGGLQGQPAADRPERGAGEDGLPRARSRRAPGARAPALDHGHQRPRRRRRRRVAVRDRVLCAAGRGARSRTV